MISSISFKNFKSYRDATLQLAPLSLLIGANASGKSNAIEGIRFLSWLAEGRHLDDLMSAVQAEDQRVRGTVQNLVYQAHDDTSERNDTFGFDCDSHVRFKATFQIRLQVTSEGMRVISEVVTELYERVPLYEVVGPAKKFSHEVSVRYNNFAPGGIKPQIPCSGQQAVFTQLDTPARFSTKRAQKFIPQTVRGFRQFCDQILFLDPSPRAMRQYSFIVEKNLDGRHVERYSVRRLCIGDEIRDWHIEPRTYAVFPYVNEKLGIWK